MASITKQTVGNNTYLYESHSFRDDKGRPRNHKVKIGKIDRNTGRARYTQEYIDRMRKEGKSGICFEYDDIEVISIAIYSSLMFSVHHTLKKSYRSFWSNAPSNSLNL